MKTLSNILEENTFFKLKQLVQIPLTLFLMHFLTFACLLTGIEIHIIIQNTSLNKSSEYFLLLRLVFCITELM